jgi:hypothetical protein
MGHNFKNWQKGILRMDGFIHEEIEAWDNATNPDGSPHYMNFYSGTFTDMRRDRRQWCRDRRDEGWSHEQCDNELYDNFHASHEKSPWAWLDAAYRPPRKLRDFSAASRKRATTRRRKARERIRHIAE